jgi:aldose 1-epimerase
MTRLAFDGADVLEPVVDWTPPGRAWPAAGLYPLVPYSNRIEHGRLRVGGREVQLAIHPFAAPHAVHGPGHRRAWQVLGHSGRRTRLFLDYAADEDWPWPFEARLDYAFEDDTVVTHLRLRNRASEPMPAGLGLHPFFHAPNGTRYTLSCQDRWMQTEADGPVPRFLDPSARIDTQVSEEGLIACLGRCIRHVTVRRPDLAITIQSSPELTHLVVYRAAGSSFLCIEPVSHATDAFNLQAAGYGYTGALLLDPDESLEGTMTIRCERPSSAR